MQTSKKKPTFGERINAFFNPFAVEEAKLYYNPALLPKKLSPQQELSDELESISKWPDCRETFERRASIYYRRLHICQHKIDDNLSRERSNETDRELMRLRAEYNALQKTAEQYTHAASLFDDAHSKILDNRVATVKFIKRRSTGIATEKFIECSDFDLLSTAPISFEADVIHLNVRFNEKNIDKIIEFLENSKPCFVKNDEVVDKATSEANKL